MSPARNFQEESYQRHSEHYKQYSISGEKELQAKIWFEKDTVDAWRHQRMYQALDPILISDPKAKWLTVGDGRFGRDAKYIIEEGCYALASDISDCLLEEARQIGYLSEYKRENAEALSFQDYEFDYVLCKESYHHFPRPMLALYEMLRVARKGVFLIEPNDVYINRKALEILFRNLKNIIKSLLHKKINKHAFEEAGNYVFSIYKRD